MSRRSSRPQRQAQSPLPVSSSSSSSSLTTIGSLFQEDEQWNADPETQSVASTEGIDTDGPRAQLIRIPPWCYVHILDTNLNVTRLEVGPQSLTCLDHEKVVLGPAKMIVVPPRHYCVVSNPVVYTTNEKGIKEVVKDRFGQAKLHHGDSEIRLEQQDPFPLYPGEKLLGGIQPLTVVEDDCALRLRAIRNFTDKYSKDSKGNPIYRQAGEEWLFKGPGTYIPQVEVEVVENVKACVLQPGQAVHLKARCEYVDRNGVKRKAGEEWLVRTEGAYLPDVEESVEKIVTARILERNKTALHLRATNTFVDCYGKERKAGEEWLVTYEDSETHIQDVYEEIVKVVNSIVLTNRNYCVIEDYVDEDGVQQLGKQKMVKGEACFFLKPGEKLRDNAVFNSYVLAPEEALIVAAREEFEDGKRKRRPGDRWFVYGPAEYFPPPQVRVIEGRRALLRIDALGLYMFYSKFSVVLFFLVILLAYYVQRYLYV